MRLNVQATPKQKVRAKVAADTEISALRNMTPDEIDAWIEANSVSMVQIRQILKLLVKLALTNAQQV